MNDRQIILGVVIMITLGISILVPAYGVTSRGVTSAKSELKAPAVISGDNIYIAWWTNKSGNDEVMFRASSDAGQTFGDKINLSNTTDADSTRTEIATGGRNVIVTWWETNQTDDTPVMKVSTDNGKTFGPMLKLGTNGTLGTGEAKPLLP
jgi:hypothetical protein